MASGDGSMAQHELSLLAGSGGEPDTARSVQRLRQEVAADGDALTSIDLALRVSCRHCHEVGRDPDTITRTATLGVHIARDDRELDWNLAPHLGDRSRADLAATCAIGTPAELVDLFGALIDAGIEHFILYLHPPTDPHPMQLFYEQVIAKLP